MAQSPKGGSYGPPSKGHLGGCAIYSDLLRTHCHVLKQGIVVTMFRGRVEVGTFQGDKCSKCHIKGDSEFRVEDLTGGRAGRLLGVCSTAEFAGPYVATPGGQPSLCYLYT